MKDYHSGKMEEGLVRGSLKGGPLRDKKGVGAELWED